MSPFPDPAQAHVLALFRAWLGERYEGEFSPATAAGAGMASFLREGARINAVVVSLCREDEGSPSWRAAGEALEAALNAADVPGSYLLWLPPGAVPPDGDGDDGRRGMVKRMAEAAKGLAPGERTAVGLPIGLDLRKVEDEGAIIQIAGGMATVWARFTGRVRGTYRLNSHALHRLPEERERLEALLDAIVTGAEGLGEAGERTSIQTTDDWTLQRLGDGDGRGFALVAAPPSNEANSGGQVRRELRRVLRESQVQMGGSALGDAYRALVLVGAYAHDRDENVSLALRGFDPTIYAGIDFIMLAVDGRMKPIYISPRVRL
ncbi:MAG: hypothetical protein EXR43_03025 [Dehalococcoidia bacterium]|nr:hypothetical protein [Dehalococcoidia bacterium]